MDETPIPIHDFTRDDDTSIPFAVNPLEVRNRYDSSSPHRHNYFEVFLFDKGGGEHLIDFSTFPIAGRSVHFVSPGQVHLVKRALDSRGLLISFSREFYLRHLENKERLFEMPYLYRRAPVLELTEKAYEELRSVTRHIEDEVTRNGTQTGELVHAWFTIFLLRCAEHYEAGPGDPLPFDDKRQLAYRFRALVEENFRKWHGVAHYIDALNTSPDPLNEAVKTHFGQTAGSLIAQRITLEARRLLHHSGHSVKEIAYFLDFNDPAYFSRFFKNHTGKTPQQFREMRS